MDIIVINNSLLKMFYHWTPPKKTVKHFLYSVNTVFNFETTKK